MVARQAIVSVHLFTSFYLKNVDKVKFVCTVESMKLKTERQITLIVNSFKRVFEKNDIDELTKQAYGFIYLASGFIAHYNLYGFREAYCNVDDLKEDILRNKDINQWNNFRKGERDYEYYMQKKEIYNKILDLI
jgi:hypothetical protein